MVKRITPLVAVLSLALPLLMGVKGCGQAGATPHAASAGGGSAVLVWTPTHTGSSTGAWRTVSAGALGAAGGLALAEAIKPKVEAPGATGRVVKVSVSKDVDPADPCGNHNGSDPQPGVFRLVTFRISSFGSPISLDCHWFNRITQRGSKVRFARFVNCISNVIAVGLFSFGGGRSSWKTASGEVTANGDDLIIDVSPSYWSWKDCAA